MKKKQDVDKGPSGREGKTMENSKVNEEEEQAVDVPKNQNPSSSKSNPSSEVVPNTQVSNQSRDSSEGSKQELQLHGRVTRVKWEWDLNEKIGSDSDESKPDDDSSENQLESSVLHKSTSTATQNGLSDPKEIQAAATLLRMRLGGKQFLFDQELTDFDVSNTHVRIPKREAETHFPSLKTRIPGTYRQEVLHITDEHGKNWYMTLGYNECVPGYIINSGWKEFADEHCLESGDFIRFYRAVHPIDTKHYLIEYVKMKEARISYPQRANDEDTALFEQELNSVDVAVRSPGFVIPRTVVDKYYYPSRSKIPPEGIAFKEEEEWIILSDGNWIVCMEFDPYVEGYTTMRNGWREYVKENGLEAGDLIRFYRPLRPFHKNRFLIRRVKANKG